ncbi:unnamed protein product [Periconia digitata]|uniref:Uncharacterized protein n=1 Tax=Periconia digitata TaxID=1303443 RepID=A0A9W4U3U8_9PLEO|nr:unnamed protein product [Periconia digitata]
MFNGDVQWAHLHMTQSSSDPDPGQSHSFLHTPRHGRQSSVVSRQSSASWNPLTIDPVDTLHIPLHHQPCRSTLVPETSLLPLHTTRNLANSNFFSSPSSSRLGLIRLRQEQVTYIPTFLNPTPCPTSKLNLPHALFAWLLWTVSPDIHAPMTTLTVLPFISTSFTAILPFLTGRHLAE